MPEVDGHYDVNPQQAARKAKDAKAAKETPAEPLPVTAPPAEQNFCPHCGQSMKPIGQMSLDPKDWHDNSPQEKTK